MNKPQMIESVWIVHANNFIYGAFTSRDKAEEMKKAVSAGFRAEGFIDDRVFLTNRSVSK